RQIGRNQRWVATAAQDHVALDNPVLIRGSTINGGTVAKIGAQVRHRGGGGEHLGIGCGVKPNRSIVRKEDVSARGFDDLDSDLRAAERGLVKNVSDPLT